MNRVEIIGGLTRPPDIRRTQGGMMVVEMNLALNDAGYSSKERAQVVKTSYVAVVCFGWLAEEVVNIGLDKGDEVYVLGRLDQSTFEKQDGTKESKTKVAASIVTPTKIRNPMPQGPPSTPGYEAGEEPF